MVTSCASYGTLGTVVSKSNICKPMWGKFTHTIKKIYILNSAWLTLQRLLCFWRPAIMGSVSRQEAAKWLQEVPEAQYVRRVSRCSRCTLYIHYTDTQKCYIAWGTYPSPAVVSRQISPAVISGELLPCISGACTALCTVHIRSNSLPHGTNKLY